MHVYFSPDVLMAFGTGSPKDYRHVEDCYLGAATGEQLEPLNWNLITSEVYRGYWWRLEEDLANFASVHQFKSLDEGVNSNARWSLEDCVLILCSDVFRTLCA